jgi:fluoride ion exporter CrcB/FEX
VLYELSLVGFFAAFGGFTRTIVGKKCNEKYSFKVALGEVVIAIFAGYLLHFIMSPHDICSGYKIAAIGLAGFSARELLNMLRMGFLKKFNIGTDIGTSNGKDLRKNQE